jgi:hypothetical protein
MIQYGAFFKAYMLGRMSCPLAGLLSPFWVILGVPKWPKNSPKWPKQPIFWVWLEKINFIKDCQFSMIFMLKSTQFIHSFVPIVLNLSILGDICQKWGSKGEKNFFHTFD